MILAICYGWLSGFNPPVIRALLALSLWQILSLKKIFLSSWQIINRIIAILLFIDPFMILAESFWLSCYAVICLIFITHWFPSKSSKYPQQTYLWQLVKLQCLLTLLLLPIQFLIFNGISGTSIMANLIAIPTISFITFPAVLLMLLMSFFDFFYLAIWFGMIAEKSISGLFILLTQLSGYWFAIADGFYLLSGIGWLMVIIWQTMLWRSYLLSLIVVILIALSPMIKRQSYNWRVDMLDVGHGLAVVITKGKSAIVYDTGAMWQNSSAAELIILPFLQWHNLTVEGIIISHEHNDHIGGLAILKQYFPNAWLMSSSNRLSNNYICTSGNQLSWQGLQLAVLWPNKVLDDVDQSAMNARSCVIRISDNRYSILLTGDLERKQEELLVLDKNKILSSTILQTPHHGSNTSSYYPFLAKVNPELSLASVARYNPWKLPSNKALSRYQDLNLSYRLTSISGQISVSFYDKKWLLETMREEIKPRWYHDWFGALPNYR
ncbi:DNA internalization-related competence protein ComEC/Rec2 [Orbus mooreae]|uniref:DNA internalization-related competence protein ComEC/Rec2 n=1 Tax=Orbus mooreae TaxID=3074107 RepID=UPI00370D2A5C